MCSACAGLSMLQGAAFASAPPQAALWRAIARVERPNQAPRVQGRSGTTRSGHLAGPRFLAAS